MSFARAVRHAIPLGWQPRVRYYYERWRGLAEREMPIVCDAVRPGDLVADIGASHGVYTYALARRGASVEAFEPQAECAGVLEAFARSVGGSVRVHRLALGASAGAGELVAAGDGRGPETRIKPAEPSSGAASIRVAALDDLALGSFALLKIDVEGGEADVLAGAETTIRRDRPLIFVEIEQRHLTCPIGEVFDYMKSLEYDIDFVDGAGRPLDVRDFDLERHQDVSAIGDPKRVYINNFFLSHRSGSRRWFG